MRFQNMQKDPGCQRNSMLPLSPHFLSISPLPSLSIEATTWHKSMMDLLLCVKKVPIQCQASLGEAVASNWHKGGWLGPHCFSSREICTSLNGGKGEVKCPPFSVTEVGWGDALPL